MRAVAYAFAEPHMPSMGKEKMYKPKAKVDVGSAQAGRKNEYAECLGSKKIKISLFSAK